LCPAVDGLVAYERGGGLRGALAALGKGVPKTGREICFVLPKSFSSALVALVSGAPRRVGYAGELRAEHLTTAYVRLLELATGEREKEIPFPVVVPPYEWQELLAAMDLEPGYIVISPGAEYGGAKMWPAGSYATFVRSLSQRTEGGIVVIGSESERNVAEEIVSESGVSARNLAGECSIDQLLAILRGASLIVGNDSGPVHISAAMGRPTLTIFGSTSPSWTSPKGRSVEIVRADLDCSPCFERECPHGEPRCMLDIDPKRVFDLAYRMIGEGRLEEEARKNH
jgi:heptosyltransferase-2